MGYIYIHVFQHRKAGLRINRYTILSPLCGLLFCVSYFCFRYLLCSLLVYFRLLEHFLFCSVTSSIISMFFCTTNAFLSKSGFSLGVHKFAKERDDIRLIEFKDTF